LNILEEMRKFYEFNRSSFSPHFHMAVPTGSRSPVFFAASDEPRPNPTASASAGRFGEAQIMIFGFILACLVIGAVYVIYLHIYNKRHQIRSPTVKKQDSLSDSPMSDSAHWL
jgi:ABC-type phosphate transport system permease subunit